MQPALLFGQPGPECGNRAYVTQADRQRNQFLLVQAKTRFKVGEVVLLNGKHPVRITQVQPRGFISMSASRSNIAHAVLPAVVSDQEVYRYESLGSAGAPRSGQTTVDCLRPRSH